MTALLLLIPLGIVVLVGALVAFSWAVRSGQFDELDTPGLDILVDEDPPRDDA